MSSDELEVILRARQYEFRFPGPALVMGIINVTPDSFSDGGKYFHAEAAVEHGRQLAAEGAAILDVGGESTRPGSASVSEAEELRRVLPVIEKLAGTVRMPISIDTMKPAVARAALEAGASIVNDVGANRDDDAMRRVAAQRGAAYVCMHMQGTPETMQLRPTYTDVAAEVRAFFVDRLERLRHCGVAPEQIILDPGIGFGKDLKHNLELLGRVGELAEFGRPLLLGASRKSFIGKLLGVDLGERLPASLACACLAIQAGVNLVRTHDVAATVQAVRMTEAVLANRQS